MGPGKQSAAPGRLAVSKTQMADHPYLVDGDDRCACGKPFCNAPAKHPIPHLVPHGIKDATLDQSTAINWWTKCPKANIAIALGKVSGLVVIDVDGPQGAELLEKLLDKYEFTLNPKWFVETGRADGGRHYYFSYPPNVSVPTRKIKGLEVRSDGTYVVVPPSIHSRARSIDGGIFHPEATLMSYRSASSILQSLARKHLTGKLYRTEGRPA